MVCGYYSEDEEDRLQLVGDLNRLTAMLCEVCQKIEKHNQELDYFTGDSFYFPMSDQLKQWWKQHQKDDKKKV